MIYLATASGPAVRHAISAGQLGQMVQPNAGNRIVPGAVWAADNGCFNSRWDAQRWTAWIRALPPQGCVFAVVPDVVANAEATAERWRTYATVVHSAGLPAAWVAQDGAGPADIPETAAVFIGGSTDWKLGSEARSIAAEASRRGLWVHMGRVNSLRRLRYAASIGCRSTDGTFLAYGPDQNLERLLRYGRLVNQQPTLDLGGAL